MEEGERKRERESDIRADPEASRQADTNAIALIESLLLLL
jgi:hypothetical protein